MTDGLEKPTDLQRMIDRLLAPLSKPQQRIVDITAFTYFQHANVWPTFQHVEAALDREGLDAKEIFASLPTFDGTIRYGAFASLAWIGNLRDETLLELTLLGLRQCQGPAKALAEVLVRDSLRMLALFAEERRVFNPPANEVRQLQVESGYVIERLRETPDKPAAHVLAKVMEHEPGFFTSGGIYQADPEHAKWVWTIGRGALDYQDVGLEFDKYLERVITNFNRPAGLSQRVVASPLTLPASLGYIDATWRLMMGPTEHLVVLPSAERTASLTYDAGNREEFLERVSALGDVLKSLKVPKGGKQKGGHALTKLRAFLAWKLPEEAHDRVDSALDQLGYVVDIRNSGGHAEAEPKAIAAWRSLGISPPIVDFPQAWNVVRATTVAAFDAIRDEVLSFIDTSGAEEDAD